MRIADAWRATISEAGGRFEGRRDKQSKQRSSSQLDVHACQRARRARMRSIRNACFARCSMSECAAPAAKATWIEMSADSIPAILRNLTELTGAVSLTTQTRHQTTFYETVPHVFPGFFNFWLVPFRERICAPAAYFLTPFCINS